MTANKKLTISVLVMMAGFALSSMIISIVLPHLVREFSLVGAEQGYYGLFNSITATAAILSVFLLQGRVQKFNMLIFAMLLMAVTAIWSGLSKSFGAMLAAYAVNGIGIGYFEIYASATILDLQPEKSGVYMGMLHGFFGVGALACPFLASLLLAHFGWQGAYIAFGGMMLLIALQAIVLRSAVKKNGAPAHPVPELKLTRGHWKEYAGDKLNWLFWLAMFMAIGSQNGFVYYIFSYIETALGQPEIAALSVTVFWATCTVSRFLYPRIKANPMRILLVSSTLSGLFLTAALLWAGGPMMVVASAAIGFTTAPGIPLIYNEGGRRYPQMSALSVAALSVTCYLGRGVLPPVIGAVSRGVGLQLALLIPAGLYFCCAVLAVVLLRALRRGCEERPQEV